MLKEVTRFTGLGTRDYGTATADEAIRQEHRALRVQRLKDTKLFDESKDGTSVKMSLIDIERHFDELTDALAAADAQFEADNKAFLKKHRPAGDNS